MNVRRFTAWLLLVLINGSALAAAATAASAPGKPKPSANPVEAVTEKPAVTELRLKNASVAAPLFVPQPGGGYAVIPVAVTAAAGAAAEASPGQLIFPQIPGAAATKVLGAVKRQLSARHTGWPLGKNIEISFSEKIAPPDVAATALAAGLLLDAMFTGYTIDPDVAVIGGLDEDGDLAAVISAATRLTAALRSPATRIIIPEKNLAQAADLMLADGVAIFATKHVFSVSAFEEVPPLANTRLDDKTVRAMQSFDEAARLLAAAGTRADAALADPRVKEALRNVLIAAPSHLSARLLLGHGAGQFHLFSLPGSIEVVESRGPSLVRALRSKSPGSFGGLTLDRATDELNALKALGPRLDERSLNWYDAILRYGETAQAWFGNPQRTPRETAQLISALNAAVQTMQREWPKLVALRDQPTARP